MTEKNLPDLFKQIPWLEAIDRSLVGNLLGVLDPTDSLETAQGKLKSLIDHEISIAFYEKKEVVYELVGSGDSINGWKFFKSSRQLFRSREEAESKMGVFREACLDPKEFDYAESPTLQVMIVERPLC